MIDEVNGMTMMIFKRRNIGVFNCHEEKSLVMNNSCPSASWMGI
jgi:hypothetical protein